MNTGDAEEQQRGEWSDASIAELTSFVPQCHHMCHMRTTLALDDDILLQVKAYADGRDISLGKAVSELVRKGLSAPLETRVVNGFHVVLLPAGSPAVSPEHVRGLEEEIE